MMITTQILSTIMVPLVFYVGGIFTGFYMRAFFDKTFTDKGNTIVLMAVTTIWVVSMLVDFLDPQYTTPLPLHALMGAIVGFFYKPVKVE